MIAPIISSKAGGLEVEPRMVLQPIDLGHLADQISDALARSNRAVSDAGYSGEGFQPFLKLAKVRSYKAFMRDARRISILKATNAFLVQEDENRGAKGFGLDRGSQPSVAPDTVLDVAQMVQKLLEGEPLKVS